MTGEKRNRRQDERKRKGIGDTMRGKEKERRR